MFSHRILSPLEAEVKKWDIGMAALALKAPKENHSLSLPASGSSHSLACGNIASIYASVSHDL